MTKVQRTENGFSNHKRGIGFLIAAALVGALPISGSAGTARPVKSFLDSRSVVSHVNQWAESYQDPVGVASNLNYLGFTMVGEDPWGDVTALDPLMKIPGMRLMTLVPYAVNDIQADIITPIKAAQSRWGHNAIYALRGFNEPNNFTSTYLGNSCGNAPGANTDWYWCGKGMADIYAAIRADSALNNLILAGIAEPGGSRNDVGIQFTSIPAGHTGSEFPVGTRFSDVLDVHAYSNHASQFEFCQASADGSACNDQDSNLFGNHGPSVWGCSDPANQGCTSYGGYAQSQLPSIPKLTSEWGTVSVGFEAGYPATERLQAVIAIDGYLDFFQQGWIAAQYYQLRDQPSSSPDQQSDGFFHGDGSPKVAATYIHNVSAILADNSAIAKPGTISNSISGGDSYTHDVLLQKSDGSYWWAVWRESASGSATVTLTFGSTASGIATYDPTVGTSGTSRPDGASLAVTLTDHPLFVKFSVGGTVTPPPAPSPSTTQLVDKNSGKCVDVPGFDTSSGIGIDIWDCADGGSNHIFSFTAKGSGLYAIKNLNSGLCLDYTRGVGKQVLQKTCSSASSQLWFAARNGDGTYAFKSRDKKNCMDVTGAGSDNGTSLEIWNCITGAPNESFQVSGQPF